MEHPADPAKEMFKILGAALKQYADAAAPLYNSLDDGQKQRFEILSRIGRPRFAFFHGERGGDRGGFGGDRGGFRGDRDEGFRGEYRGNVPRPRDFR